MDIARTFKFTFNSFVISIKIIGLGILFSICTGMFVFVWQNPLYTIMVYDKFQHVILVTWVLAEWWEAADIALILKVVKKATEEKRVAFYLDKWQPTCWIVDCVDEEQKNIT